MKYRELEPGEVLQDGDEWIYYSDSALGDPSQWDDSEWDLIPPWMVGRKAPDIGYRRPLGSETGIPEDFVAYELGHSRPRRFKKNKEGSWDQFRWSDDGMWAFFDNHGDTSVKEYFDSADFVFAYRPK